jgi:hypothetical protein
VHWISLALDVAVASGDCAPLSSDGWASLLSTAETSFEALDQPGFDRGLDQAGAAVSCLSERLSPSLAGRYHRLVGLRLYVRDPERAALAFAAARDVDPFGVLPATLVPAGHEIHAFAAAADTDGRTTDVRRPRRGAIWFDGVATTRRPADRPTLVQIEVSGAIAASRYLAPGDTLPPYEPSWAPTRKTARWAVGSGGAALGVTSAVLYGLAIGVAGRIDGPLDPAEVDRADVIALQGAANRLVVGSIATGLAGGVAIGWAVVR